MTVSPRFLFVIAFFCTTLLCSHVSFSQRNYNVDSLKKVVATGVKLARVDALNKLSEAYRVTGRSDSAQVLAIQAAKESEKMNYVLGEGNAYLNMAYIGFQLSDFAKVEADCRKAMELFRKVNDNKRLPRAHNVLGQAIWAQGEFDLANEEFNKAIQIFTQSKDSVGLGYSYSLVATLEEERGNYERSFQYAVKALNCHEERAYTVLGQLSADVGDYRTAIEYYGKIKNKGLILYNYIKVGEVYDRQHNYDSAMFYYRLFLREGGLLENRLNKAYALLGGLYLEMEKYDSALFYLNTSLKYFERTNDRNWTMRVSQQLASTYRDVGNVQTGIMYSRRLLSTARTSGARQYLRDGHYLLFELFDGLHQRDSAYEHLKNYTILNSAIDIDVSARNLAFYKMASEGQQAQLKIDLLNKQKQLQEESLQQTAQQKKFLYVSILAIIFIAIVLVRNILLKKRNEEHRRELLESELQIQKLESKKQLGELEIQLLRTQMNPHFIFNSLNSINRFILQNNRLMASEYLTKFSRLVRMILQNSESAWITVKEELEALELYLNLEAVRFDDHFSYNITVEDELDVESLKVPPLLVQPYAENAIWHGLMHKEEKGQIDIKVWVEEGWLYLKITDDGIGRRKAHIVEQKNHSNHRPMGLGITAHRIAMAHDQNSQGQGVEIKDLVDPDGEPCGTEVVIKLPVKL